MDMLSNLQQQRILVEQLRREAAIKRINVSQAIEDLKKYITDNEAEDYLLVGFPSQKSNPFREKSSCSMLWSHDVIHHYGRSNDVIDAFSTSPKSFSICC